MPLALDLRAMRCGAGWNARSPDTDSSIGSSSARVTAIAAPKARSTGPAIPFASIVELWDPVAMVTVLPVDVRDKPTDTSASASRPNETTRPGANVLRWSIDGPE